MSALIRRLVSEDAGQDLIEYVFLAAFISIVALAVIRAIGEDVSTLYGPVIGGTTAAASSS